MKADLIERLRAHPNKFIGHWEDWADEAGTLMLEAADRIAALEAEASEGERLRAALRIIRLLDWSWPGGGSLTRVPGAQGRTASRALGLPEELPNGWPSDAEYEEVRLARRSLIPEAPVREGWQPISSAPKDGSEIILHDRGTVGTGFYSEAPEARRAEAGWFWEDDRGNLLIAKNADPTHWMPLPSPPQDREEQ